jgi:hypothetical protein
MPVETLSFISIKFPLMVPLSAKRATTLSPSALLQGGQQPDAMDISSYSYLICQIDSFLYDLYRIKPMN